MIQVGFDVRGSDAFRTFPILSRLWRVHRALHGLMLALFLAGKEWLFRTSALSLSLSLPLLPLYPCHPICPNPISHLSHHRENGRGSVLLTRKQQPTSGQTQCVHPHGVNWKQATFPETILVLFCEFVFLFSLRWSTLHAGNHSLYPKLIHHNEQSVRLYLQLTLHSLSVLHCNCITLFYWWWTYTLHTFTTFYS